MPNGVSKTYKFGPINRPYQTVINTKTPIELETLYHLSKRNAEGQSDYRTTQISQETLGGRQYRYSYDKLGNITKIEARSSTSSSFSKQVAYQYDSLSQLVREDNIYTGKTRVYTYDNGGNILKETEYPYTTGTVGTPTATNNYGYGDANWKDKLTSYNGQAITYDAIGNPLSYRGYNLTWANGRQLSTLGGNGVTASYKYDANGLRTEKTVNGIKTSYYYVGDELVYEKRGSDKELYYFYDESGAHSGIRYILNGQVSDYVVVTNWRGDVEALYDLNGALVAQYIYDTWGSQISIQDGNGNEITNQTHIATVNPFRYRGYYLDTETGLYYLQSRYYDAETHRFINADKHLNANNDLLGNNLYAYCSNNPIIFQDELGEGKVLNSLKSLGKKISDWWNRTPSVSAPVAAENLAMGAGHAASAAGNVSGASGHALAGIKNPSKAKTSERGTIIFDPDSAKLRNKYSDNTLKKINNIGTVLTVVTSSIEISDTWLADNSNTNGKRVIKTGIQLLGIAASIGVGALANLGGTCVAEAGPVAVFITVVGINAVGDYLIGVGEQYLYNKFNIV